MKRLFDVFGSLALIVLLSPVYLVVGIMVLIALGRPILFVQERPGLRGKLFRMYKFRSMATRRDGCPVDDDLRLSKFGKFLRSTSLDELPELWNVIRGEMSLVGPRPLLPEYLDLYSNRQRLRHDVRPGITGWAQVNGRNAIEWAERLELDAWYVENRSFWLDLKILFLTAFQVVHRRGVSHGDHVTMPKFQGGR